MVERAASSSSVYPVRAGIVAYAPGMTTGSQAQRVPQGRKVWRSCPHRAQRMSCERCTSLVWAVSHMILPSESSVPWWLFAATGGSDGSVLEGLLV